MGCLISYIIPTVYLLTIRAEQHAGVALVAMPSRNDRTNAGVYLPNWHIGKRARRL